MEAVAIRWESIATSSKDATSSYGQYRWVLWIFADAEAPLSLERPHMKWDFPPCCVVKKQGVLEGNHVHPCSASMEPTVVLRVSSTPCLRESTPRGPPSANSTRSQAKDTVEAVEGGCICSKRVRPKSQVKTTHPGRVKNHGSKQSGR